jgi:DeoR family transcriptional regulator of aga operon
VDVAFVGIHAVTGDLLSESSLDVVEAKRAMMRAAHRGVLRADHSKFCPPSFFEVARLDGIDDLVTDDAAPPEALEAAGACGVRVHLA